MNDYKKRTQKEREQYNLGLKRDTYERVLGSSRIYFKQRRYEIFQKELPLANGGNLLELGSSSWKDWIEDKDFYPSSITCINISETELEKGRIASTSTRLRPTFLIGDAHSLKFADDSFNMVFGDGILHHLDLKVALKEIHRVLQPDGIVAFSEPLDRNPVGRIVRALTPRARTEDEEPFRKRHVRILETYFDCRYYFEEFLSVPVGVLSVILGIDSKKLLKRAFWIDNALAERLPAVGWWYRYMLVFGRPKAF